MDPGGKNPDISGIRSRITWCRDEHALHLLENGHANDNKQIDLSILLIIVMLFSRILFCNASWITVRTDSVFLSHSNETRAREREIVVIQILARFFDIIMLVTKINYLFNC